VSAWWREQNRSDAGGRTPSLGRLSSTEGGGKASCRVRKYLALLRLLLRPYPLLACAGRRVARSGSALLPRPAGTDTKASGAAHSMDSRSESRICAACTRPIPGMKRAPFCKSITSAMSYWNTGTQHLSRKRGEIPAMPPGGPQERGAVIYTVP